MSEVRFVVYGEAAGKGSVTSRYVPGRGRTFSHHPKKTVNWEALVKRVAQDHVPMGGLLKGPLEAGLRIYLLKPASKPKKCVWPEWKPDIDKLVRAVFDAMTGVIYANDAQIVRVVELFKAYGDPPRVEVMVRPIVGSREERAS